MTQLHEHVHTFFERYQAALLARDEKTIAAMYAVPSLILFPGNSIPIHEATQTEQFFAASWEQYGDVDQIEKHITITNETMGSVWVDVTWLYGGQPQERFCYQLIERAPGTYQIAVLTPLILEKTT